MVQSALWCTATLCDRIPKKSQTKWTVVQVKESIIATCSRK